ADTSGYSNHGTIVITGTGTNQSLGTCGSGTGTEAWNNGTTGKRNASIYLDGGDEYVDLADQPEFSFTDGSGTDLPFSLSFWIKNSTNAYIISKRQVGGVNEYSVSTDSSRLVTFELVASSGAYINTKTDAGYPTSTWTLVTVTYDGSETSAGMNIYFNGVLQASTDGGAGGYTGMSDTTAKLTLGGRLDTGTTLYNDMNGYIDDFRIYNYELSQAQVNRVLSNGAVRFGPTEGSP
ncbi:LamG domain-containing protein, partial [candidate division WWE3 bacterium]|nr:LamG domain-containing protein [candidate division WWE3 bacterium]